MPADRESTSLIPMTRSQLTARAQPGRREELLGALDRFGLAAASGDPDLIGVEVSVPLDDPDSVLVVMTWPSSRHHERWLAGSGWTRIRTAIEPLLAADPEWHVYRLVDAVA
jgi:quinol monooxygenase YgiN